MSCQLIETSNAAAKAVAPGASLSDVARTALLSALEQERHAQALYAAYVAEHGAIAPFTKNLKARRRRSAALASMAKAYGLSVPKAPRGADASPSEFPRDALPEDLAAACAAGAEAEAARLSRYDEDLIPAVAAYPGLVTVMSALRDRTRDRHLPALRRALASARGIPDLHGSGHVHGHGNGKGHGGAHGGCHGHSEDHLHDRAHGAHHGHSHGGCGHHHFDQPQAKGH